MHYFRGKRKDTKEWVFGDCVHSMYKLGDTCVGLYGTAQGMHQVIPETVGRFSGHYMTEDVEGGEACRTPIYEGDIVEPIQGDGIHTGFSWGCQTVVFDQGAFCLRDSRGRTTPMCNYSVSVKFMLRGNVYDTPGLGVEV